MRRRPVRDRPAESRIRPREEITKLGWLLDDIENGLATTDARAAHRRVPDFESTAAPGPVG
jgi:hypothetical protein